MYRVSTTLLCLLFSTSGSAQTLERQLLQESNTSLSKAAHDSGDARRGVILFHQVHVGCVKCHAVDGTNNSLGPNLTKLGEQKAATDEYVIASILQPSKVVRKGYESITVATTDGKTITGLLVSKTDTGIVLRDPARHGERIAIATDNIEELVSSKLSIMPAGVVNQLSDRQQFLDLLRYVLELRDGGIDVARKLQPPPGMITLQLPEYEQRVDHAGIIRKLDDDAAVRGEKIYERLCINCHGNEKRQGSLPTALRFGEGKFRNGGDPYTMYKTLTHGFGLMVPQTWMVPRQKYDVVHYIRENYVREANASQYRDVTDNYLAALPKGDTFGPEPVDYAPWSDMNYGPSMINTFEVGSKGDNFAYKGIAVRLDSGPGGIAKGNKWAIFDHDTMRFAAAWTRRPDSKDSGFINWQGIHFDGRHGTHPRVSGDVAVANPTGPGWANPETGTFDDNQRVVGRDDRNYGPLPRAWAKYRGLHTIGDQTIVEYTVAETAVLEQFGQLNVNGKGDSSTDVFTRTMSISANKRPQLALVATHPEEAVRFQTITQHSAIIAADKSMQKAVRVSEFNGASQLQISDGGDFDMTESDFSVTARIRTTEDGTIFSQTNTDGPWVPNGKAFFIRGGRLTYDIGWVGAVRSKQKVNDGKWHDVALTWNHSTGKATFYIDDRKNVTSPLRPKAIVKSQIAKIGFAAGNFPATSFFTGDIESVGFWQKELSPKQISDLRKGDLSSPKPVAAWDLKTEPANGAIGSSASEKYKATVLHGEGQPNADTIVAGILGDCEGVEIVRRDNRLCLQVPSHAEQRHFIVWTASVDRSRSVNELKDLVSKIEDRLQVANLAHQVKQSGRARWPEVVTTVPTIGAESGPFAVDVLTTPAANPWFARIRLTGHDFLSDGDRVAVCSWDGDVWMVSGLKSLGQSSHHGPRDEPRTGDSQKTSGQQSDDKRFDNESEAEDPTDTGLNTRPGTAPLVTRSDDGYVGRQLRWQRIASGLFQPLGVKIVADDVYVTCRDQLVILRDRNGDGETDFYECFNNDHQVTEHFHEFAMGLQRDEIGNFYYAKSARHAKTALVPHHGTLLRIPSDGSRTDIIANGFRAANGVCLNPDGSFIVTDQEGHWNPKNRINWVREGGFYGNMFGYHDVTDDSDEAMQQPLCWITNAFDRSPAELMWIDNEAWGSLNGTLLNLSYGYGKVYVVPHEEIDGQMQGGMCQLPIPQFPTGTARGRISPHDNGLYLCGMFAWGSSQQAQEGGFYRLRYTGQASNLPVGLNAAGKELKITFTDSLDQNRAADVNSYVVKIWSLKRSANYGSKHYDEHEIQVTAATVSADGKAVTLTIPQLAKTWCMEVKCRLKSANGDEFERVIHNTIHRVD